MEVIMIHSLTVLPITSTFPYPATWQKLGLIHHSPANFSEADIFTLIIDNDYPRDKTQVRCSVTREQMIAFRDKIDEALEGPLTDNVPQEEMFVAFPVDALPVHF